MVTVPPALGRQAAMFGDGTSENVNGVAVRTGALVAAAGVRPTEAARTPATAVLPRPAAVQARVRRWRFLMLRMGSPGSDGGVVAAPPAGSRAGSAGGGLMSGRGTQRRARRVQRNLREFSGPSFLARRGGLRSGCSAGCGR